MFFPNGQDYNVILCVEGTQYLIHEPMPVVPRMHEWLCYHDQWYLVKSVECVYPFRINKHVKADIYLRCEAYDVPTIYAN